jgi:hypothetical protein
MRCRCLPDRFTALLNGETAMLVAGLRHFFSLAPVAEEMAARGVPWPRPMLVA